MARALLIVPPFIKYSAGPLLGPALLQSAARQRGHTCSVLDLNAHFIRKQSPGRAVRRGKFVGDHDKPKDGMSSSSDLSRIERRFLCDTVLPSLDFGGDANALKRVQFGFLEHKKVEVSATRLASTPFGAWTRELLLEKSGGDAQPNLLGVSLLHAGQVLPAAMISFLARELWPQALIVWGGPHISGIQDALREDIDKRLFAADLFVTGHAEQTFVGLLDQLSSESRLTLSSGHIEGLRGSSVVPRFEDLNLYDDPPVLPAQSTLGCAYGRCAFCTYPAMEPTPQKLDLCITVDSVVEQARRVNGSIAIKDSLVTPRRLKDIGTTIRGRVKWSACTKLNQKLTLDTLSRLNTTGLATLEVGLESLLIDTQQRVAKVHPPKQFEEFLGNAAKVPGLSLVVNYMTGFPWEDPEASQLKLFEARSLLHSYLGSSRGLLEHNHFELERLSPMAKEPEHFGIDSASLKFWPWASVVDYDNANHL